MPVAVSNVEELHAQACALEWGDADEAMALYFQLKTALRGDNANMALRDALVSACQIIGYRDEAIEHLDVLDRSGMKAGTALAFNAQGHLIQFGFIDRGMARATELLHTLPTMQPTLLENLAFTAALTADDGLYAGLTSRGSKHADAFFNHIKQLGVGVYLPNLQLLALQAASQYLMGISVNTDEDPETGVVCFISTLLIDGSLIHPSDLFDQIHEAQGLYAAGFPNQGADWWPHYFVDVKAAPRHHSIPAKPRMRKAA